MAAGESKEADFAEILLVIVERLRSNVKGCNPATCYFAIDPDSLTKTNPGTHVVIVSPASGRFRSGAFAGGGRNFLAVDGGFFVKIHFPTLVDQQDRDVQAITSQSIGLMRIATQVLKALLEPWVPAVNATAGFFHLTGSLEPLNFDISKDEKDVVRAIEFAFACPFDWDLTKT